MAPKRNLSRRSQAWLEKAYKLASPDDNRNYYRDFAPAYDAEFAASLGYCYPRMIADSFLEEAVPCDATIADIGCGTGLVGEALPPNLIVDGFDISPEMLEKARSKGVYSALHELDITDELCGFQNQYGAILSAGTFTHGHLGPEILPDLLGIGKEHALFVIGVNKSHFDPMGFAAVLQDMEASHLISKPHLKEAGIYELIGHSHSDDRAVVMRFRKSCSEKS